MIETAFLLSMPPTFAPFLISIAAILVTLVYGCIEDLKDRTVPAVMWYPALVIGSICLASFIWETHTLEHIGYLFPIFCMMAFFIIAFYLFAFFHLFGLGDAKALITITICVPLFPFLPLLGYPPYGIVPYVFFPLSMLANTVLITILVPLFIFLYNLCKRNIAPISIMFLGVPVPSKDLQDTYGIVMERFKVQDKTIQREFIGFWAALHQMITGEGRVYTKDLRENPKAYKKQLEVYNQVDSIWISYALPYLIPITIGFIVTFICGDLMYAILRHLF